MRFLENNKYLFFIAICLSFILYSNTLTHSYTLDDAIVITKNEFTKQGLSGIKDIFANESFTGFFGRNKELVSGGRYRPLSIVTFAVEYEFFGENPFLSHLINILLYSIIIFFIYQVVLKLLADRLSEKSAKILGLIAAIIFAIHPIHTECVANIKGRDELLCLLFSLWAFLSILKYIKTHKTKNLIAGSVLLFLGMLTKENAITFVVIIPLGVWFFKSDTYKNIGIVFGVLSLGAIIFIVIRTKVLGGLSFAEANELMNNPFVNATGSQKLATVLFTWLIYLKLLIFPHPLTFDYYPKHIPIVEFNNPGVIVVILLLTLLAIIAFQGLKTKSLISFSVIAFALSFSPVSNLLFSVGTFMNERFVFTPSLFWSLAMTYLIVELYQHKKLKFLALLPIIYMLTFYPAKTIARNKVWKDDFTLFTTDVKTSKESAKSNCSAGGQLWEAGKKLEKGTKQTNYFKKSEKYLRKAVSIHNTYADAWLLLGNVLYDLHTDIDGASTCYLNVIKLQPANPNAWKNIDIVLQNSENRELQLKYYQELYQIKPNDYKTNYRLGVLHGRYLNNLPKGIFFLEKAVDISPNNIEALKDLGTAYGMSQQAEKAYPVFNKILSIDTTDLQVYINLGLACQQLGKLTEAKKHFEKVETLKKK